MELREHGRKHEGDQQQRWPHRMWQTPTSNTGVELSLPSFGTHGGRAVCSPCPPPATRRRAPALQKSGLGKCSWFNNSCQVVHLKILFPSCSSNFDSVTFYQQDGKTPTQKKWIIIILEEVDDPKEDIDQYMHAILNRLDAIGVGLTFVAGWNTLRQFLHSQGCECRVAQQDNLEKCAGRWVQANDLYIDMMIACKNKNRSDPIEIRSVHTVWNSHT